MEDQELNGADSPIGLGKILPIAREIRERLALVGGSASLEGITVAADRRHRLAGIRRFEEPNYWLRDESALPHVCRFGWAKAPSSCLGSSGVGQVIRIHARARGTRTMKRLGLPASGPPQPSERTYGLDMSKGVD